MAEITQEELDKRVDLLHRFKDLLKQQRTKFQEYLTVLEKQQDSISAEDPEHLLAHTELEQQVVKNLANLQKVIVPMKKMYANSKDTTGKEDAEITKIQSELTDLQTKVLKQNEINRDLLRVHIEQLKTRMNNFKNPYKNVTSVYGKTQPNKVATLISVEA